MLLLRATHPHQSKGHNLWNLCCTSTLQVTHQTQVSLCAQVIEDAAREFQGGPEQALVIIARSQLALARGEVDAALALLRQVLHLTAASPSAPHTSAPYSCTLHFCTPHFCTLLLHPVLPLPTLLHPTSALHFFTCVYQAHSLSPGVQRFCFAYSIGLYQTLLCD